MFTSKFSELEQELAELKKSYFNVIDESTKALEIIAKYMAILEEHLISYKFPSKADEIEYFKFQLPLIYQYYFYYKTIYSIENERELSYFNKEDEIEYYSKCSKELSQIYSNDKEIIKYIRSNLNHLDRKFFLRKNATWRTKHLNSINHNTNTFNSVSFTIGKDKALEVIIKYIEDKIQRLKNPDKPERKKIKLKWTATKVVLVELIYGLFLLNVINSGNIEMHELIHEFEEFFDIDLKHHRSILQDIRERKINKTKFIDQLREVLITHK